MADDKFDTAKRFLLATGVLSPAMLPGTAKKIQNENTIEELEKFAAKEKIKQEFSETSAAIDKLNELLKNLNRQGVKTDNIAGSAEGNEKQTSDTVSPRDMTMAMVRGVAKKTLGVEMPQTESEIQRDLDLKAREESTKVTARKEAEQKVKMDDFLNEYDAFSQVNNALQPFRSTGGMLNRAKAGFNLFIAGLSQDSPLGNIVSTYDASVKKLRVSIARLKDVGNLSSVEQTAAQAIIPGKWDSQETAALKDAYLKDIAQAALKDEKIPAARKKYVKEIIEKWMKTSEWKEQAENLWKSMPAAERMRRTFNTVEEAESSDVPNGTFVLIDGRLAIKE